MVIQYKVVTPEIIYTQATKIQDLAGCIYILMCVTIICKEKGTINLKGSGGAYKRGWREEREGGGDVIIF